MKSALLPLLFLLFLLAASAQPALAADHATGADAMKCPMHDASLSSEERSAAMDKMFGKMDADADGNITRAEFDQHHEDMRREHEKHAEHASD